MTDRGDLGKAHNANRQKLCAQAKRDTINSMGEPVENWGIVGHTWAVRALAHSVATDHFAHAYLFTGAHAIGKTTLARAFAQALECTGANRPCGQCPACIKIARDRHPDVQIIEGVPVGFKFDDKTPPPPPRANDIERRTLKIDQIRVLQHQIARAPFEGRWRVIILRRFEEANEEAGNAFLKTLEEPPKHTRIILTARDPHVLLPTIVSRCQTLALRPLARDEVENALVARWNIVRERAHLIARLSGGRMGWAVRASADSKLLDTRRTHLDTLDTILREGRAERFTRADKLSKSDDLLQMLDAWLGWWRDVLLIQNGDDTRVTNIDRDPSLRESATRIAPEQTQRALQAVRAATRQIHQNVNTRLALEVLMLSLPIN
ncbi:MAG: DNA polymerase III subunit [Chloroflexi bacterium]|nr:DNA polymerase III subunit [Chloroflexota bacterium]